MLDCLHDESPDVQLAALRALAKFDDLGAQFFAQAFSKYRVSKSLQHILAYSFAHNQRQVRGRICPIGSLRQTARSHERVGTILSELRIGGRCKCQMNIQVRM